MLSLRQALIQHLKACPTFVSVETCRLISSEALVYSNYGDPRKVLEIQRPDLPQLLPSEVRVSILAVSILC